MKKKNIKKSKTTIFKNTFLLVLLFMILLISFIFKYYFISSTNYYIESFNYNKSKFVEKNITYEKANNYELFNSLKYNNIFGVYNKIITGKDSIIYNNSKRTYAFLKNNASYLERTHIAIGFAEIKESKWNKFIKEYNILSSVDLAKRVNEVNINSTNYFSTYYTIAKKIHELDFYNACFIEYKDLFIYHSNIDIIVYKNNSKYTIFLENNKDYYTIIINDISNTMTLDELEMFIKTISIEE